MAKNKLYLLTVILLLAGYSYLYWVIFYNTPTQHHTTVCLFKNITGYPCPGCGSTRAVAALANGHLHEAALINPLGLLIAFFMLLLPFWLAYDFATKKETYALAYKKANRVLRIKWVTAIFIILTAANWIWNIYKEI